MKLRKILSVLLCVAAVLSVMAIVAMHAQAADAVAPRDPWSTLPPSTTTAGPTTTTKGFMQQVGDWWENFYPSFDAIYKVGFNLVSKVLVMGFQFLLSLVGLNQWGGGILGIF